MFTGRLTVGYRPQDISRHPGEEGTERLQAGLDSGGNRGGAASALTGVATHKGGLLPAWAGALPFTAYGLAFAAAGTLLIQRRDIA